MMAADSGDALTAAEIITAAESGLAEIAALMIAEMSASEAPVLAAAAISVATWLMASALTGAAGSSD